MVVKQLQAKDVLDVARRRLGLPLSSTPIDEPFLAAMVRHTAGIHCPCSRTSLRSTISESLRTLSANDPLSADLIAEAIEASIVSGDLLELKDVSTAEGDAKSTWLFATPPAFSARPSGTIFLIGVVPDQDLFLPHALASRIVYEGATRLIEPAAGENLGSELRELGLQEWSQELWLKAPPPLAAQALLADMTRRIEAAPPSGALSGVELLDPDRPVTFYSGRWTSAKDQTGCYVARRPQEYGAPIWGFANLQGGYLQAFVDFPLAAYRWRGCDAAWHLQMAIDCCRGKPQLYRLTTFGDGMRFDFFSPLPLWSQRRFLLLGRSLPRDRALLSYWIPKGEAATEEQFLVDRLYLGARPDEQAGA